MTTLTVWLKRKSDDVLARWKRDEISLRDAVRELVGLGWNVHRAWATLERI